MPFLEIQSSLTIAQWLIFLANFTIFILISLEIFTMILDVRIFTVLKEKISAVVENFCILVVDHFSVFKECILIGLCELSKNICTAILGGDLTSSSLIQNPYNKIYGLSMKKIHIGSLFYL